MRRTAEEAAQTREDILAAALREFSQYGYHAANLGRIAKAAGVTRGAVYHHFENKAELYQALLESANLAGGSVLAEAVAAGGGDALTICEQILVRWFALVEENQQVRDILRLWMFQSNQAPVLAAVEARLINQSQANLAAIAQYMQFGIDQGSLRADLDPLAAARAFSAFQNGVIQQWLLLADTFSLKQDGPALARAFLWGFRP